MRARNTAIMAGCAAVWLVSCLSATAAETDRWWKGNLHTHTLWSDGDDYPETVTDWYKTNGYHFLVLSDHNIVQQGEKWATIDRNKGGRAAFERYRGRFGADWAVTRSLGNTRQVRLKALDEFRPMFEEPDRFLLMTGQEITDRWKVLPLHLNAWNIEEFIAPRHGSNVLDVLQRNVNAVLEQRRRTGRPMAPHINHPNFGYAVTAEDLMRVEGERFFEVYNGHPSVHNEGDDYRPGTERMWDIILAFRLGELNLGLLYGLAVDDAHHYDSMASTNSNPGRGWVMVRSARLTPETLVTALEAGDFYASSGVGLRDIRRDGREWELSIDGEPGVTYTTRFIGTRRDFDRNSDPAPLPPGSAFPVTRRYSADIGSVLQETTGLRPRYRFTGDELYVRAKIVSSKPKANPYQTGETEAAWVQPQIP